MKIENINIAGIPAVVIGEKSDKAYLFIHGKLGNKEEAIEFAKIACFYGFQVVGIDLPEHGSRKSSKEKLFPWIAVPEIESVYMYMKKRWENINLRANSIGAWLAMLALQNQKIERALFVSPIVDMENLIQNMMIWANVTEKELNQKSEIITGFGETLSWRYLCWVREHHIKWRVSTQILYAGKDNLTSRAVIDEFAAKTDSNITVMENGEHWFHTDKQLRFLHKWEDENIADGIKND